MRRLGAWVIVAVMQALALLLALGNPYGWIRLALTAKHWESAR